MSLAELFQGAVGRINAELGLRRSYRAVFRTPQGERVLRDLAKFAGLDDGGDFIETAETLWSWQGRRRVVLHILNLLNEPEANVIARLQRQHGLDQEESHDQSQDAITG